MRNVFILLLFAMGVATSSAQNADPVADLADTGYGIPLAAATDPYDDSVWIATDALLLLHFLRDGSLVHGTSIASLPAALAIGLDQSVWLATGEAVLHFGRYGERLSPLPFDGRREDVRALAVDSLRDRLWVATAAGVTVFATDPGNARPPVEIAHGDATALVLDPRSGALLAIVDGSLVAIDGEGVSRSLDRVLPEGERPLTLHFDADSGALVAATSEGIVEFGSDGAVVERRAVQSGSPVPAAPFRIDPWLALMRPPDGAALQNPNAEIVLRIGATCNGLPCAIDGYLRDAHVDAMLDGVSLGESTVDPADGRTTFRQRPPLRAGLNRITGRFTDRFGHDATLDGARLALYDAATTVDASSRTAESDGTRTAKAANKPPTVSLTSPSSSAKFTAPASITLTATAADPDGTISKVEFYRGGTTLIGTTSVSPYQFTWGSVAAGAYSLTAKAYDNKSATATSAPVAITVVDNQRPVVTLTSPANDTFVLAGSAVSLAATASDPDGTIARIEFFDGTTSLGVATAAPYGVVWSSVPSGSHLVFARATDNSGATSGSPQVSVVAGAPPLVVVTGPAACTTVDAPLDVTLAADAMSPGARISSVEFFDGGVSIGTSIAAPWRATLANAAAGIHSITARAVDERGLAATSRPATFTVRAANQPPSIAIAAPAEGSHFALGSTVTFTAAASDSDGVVTAVEYWIGSSSGTRIGRATMPPYSVSWAGMPPGAYTIVAVASDDRSGSTTSPALHVTIDPNVPPTVTMTSPAANAAFKAPATIALAASASDSDGTVAKVEFYSGTTLVAAVTTPPYAAQWSNVAAGNYSISAKATDNAGAVAASAPVPVVVNSNVPPSVTVLAPYAGTQFLAPATITMTASATDSDGSIVKVDYFANGAPVGTASTPPYTAVWDGAAVGTYSITARALDDQGASAVSPAVVVTVGAPPTLTVQAPLDGAMVNDDNVLVRGTVTAPANSAASVNGIVARLDASGSFQANGVPLAPGANVITATLATLAGYSTSQSITVNRTGDGPFVVDAAPTEGIDLLEVTFTVENPANTPFARIEFDLDGNGSPGLVATPDDFVDGRLAVAYVYPIGTWIAAIKVFDDQNEVIYSTTKAIVVTASGVLASSLRAIYDGMLSQLRAGNIDGALTAFTGAAYDKYQAIFMQLQPSLATIVDQLGEVQELEFDLDLGEISIVRNTPDGPVRFIVYLIRAEDGIWRIDGM